MFLTRTFLNTIVFNSKSIINYSLHPAVFKRFTSTILNMTEAKGDYIGMPVADIVAKLEKFAPTTSAEGWDNVGLLIDPMVSRNVKNILLTNDLTESVVNEAKEKNVGLIISYHPPLFKGLKTVNGGTWKERLVINCIKESMAVFSPHTSWDVVLGGVNDWLGKAFSTMSSQPITETGCGRKLELSAPITISQALHLVKRHIGIPHVQLALGVGKNTESQISKVALCAGSGSSVLNGIEADLYLTGEMSHHDVLDAAQRGVSVILCNHSNSERGFLREFAPMLETELLEGHVKVFVSLVDSDPLQVI